MKKFVFTLQAVYNYKLTVEKLQKAELSQAQAVLRELREQETRLQAAFENNAKTLEEALAGHENVVELLREHDVYFQYLRERRKELELSIIRAEEVKNRCEAELITTMREIKTYERLREEQLIVYKKEAAAEEEKNMGDLVSFNIINEG